MTRLGGVHSIGRETYHYRWSVDHDPAVRIDPGDEVSFDINDVSSWQLTKDSTSQSLASLDASKLYPLAGPVYVNGAEPGDTLLAEVLEIKTDAFGWSCVAPGLGLLEEFKEPYLYKWSLTDSEFAHFEGGIKVPIRPFCGVMGVAPPERGSFDVTPPGRHGGNMDIRHLTAGSKLELPVWVKGALFSTGDVHAAMGDGEVCLTAIECAGRARFRFQLLKKTGLRLPRYFAPGEPAPKKGFYVATGIGPDLMEAAKSSVRNLLDYLEGKWGLRREDAYILASVCADLRIHELVDQPNWVVGASISLDVFP